MGRRSPAMSGEKDEYGGSSFLPEARFEADGRGARSYGEGVESPIVDQNWWGLA